MNTNSSIILTDDCDACRGNDNTVQEPRRCSSSSMTCKTCIARWEGWCEDPQFKEGLKASPIISCNIFMNASYQYRWSRRTNDCESCRKGGYEVFFNDDGKCIGNEKCMTCVARFTEERRKEEEQRLHRLNNPDEEDLDMCEGRCGQSLPSSQVIYRDETDGYCYGHMCDPCFELWKIEFENYPLCRVCDIKFNPEGTTEEDYIERQCEDCYDKANVWCSLTKKMIPRV